MSALSIQPTYPIFTGIDGQPLEDGYVWIGTANLDPQTNPINVYWDAALTLPAAQPIRTLAGYPANSGTPARLYVNSDYSIRVMNKNGSTVYSAPAATERYSEAVVVGIDAINVSFTPAGSGAVTTNVAAKLNEWLSVKDFGAVGDGSSCVAAINAAIVAVSAAGGGVLDIPAGEYGVDGEIILRSRVILVGKGTRSTTFKRMAGYNGDMFKTLDFDALISGNTAGGPNRFGLQDLTINGNYINVPAATGWSLRIYGRAYVVRRVDIDYCANGGFYSRWGATSAAWDDDSTDAVMEAIIDGLNIQFAKGTPVFDGPHDSQIDNMIVALPRHNQPHVAGSGNLIIGDRAGGTQFGKVHVWGDFAEWCVLNYAGSVSFSDLLVDDARVNGGLIKQLGSNCFIHARGLQYGSDSIKGIQIGDSGSSITATNNKIYLHMDRVPAVVIDFSLDGGNDISVTVTTTSATTNFAGARHATTTLTYCERGAGALATDFYNIFGGTTMNAEGIVLKPRSGTPVTTWENGFMYYDSSTNKFRGYANGVWVDLH